MFYAIVIARQGRVCQARAFTADCRRTEAPGSVIKASMEKKEARRLAGLPPNFVRPMAAIPPPDYRSTQEPPRRSGR
jgi:hypothetical protein